jgi:hypothetical protein
MSFRLILSLVAAVTLIAWLFDFAQVQQAVREPTRFLVYTNEQGKETKDSS